VKLEISVQGEGCIEGREGGEAARGRGGLVKKKGLRMELELDALQARTRHPDREHGSGLVVEAFWKTSNGLVSLGVVDRGV
jgi:hypothetical protein